MRTLITVALLVISLSAMGAAPKASAPASEQAKFQEQMALALKGDAEAQLRVGFSYALGLSGQAIDNNAATKWYRLSAEQGNANAQSYLGDMYTIGQGVLQDYKEAVKWYRLAAEQGNVYAHYNLAFMYGRGQGVLQDLVYAHMWANIAASNGNELAAKNRDLNASKMTPSQLEKAQDLARECVKKNYKGC